MQRQPNEMNTENPTTDDNEISAQKLCAGMMSLVNLDMQGGRAFTCTIRSGCAQACDATVLLLRFIAVQKLNDT